VEETRKGPVSGEETYIVEGQVNVIKKEGNLIKICPQAIYTSLATTLVKSSHIQSLQNCAIKFVVKACRSMSQTS
jgi:exosome complex RNA-binding protein Rrp42 (RNase PH superfamily)